MGKLLENNFKGIQISEKQAVSLNFWENGCKYFTVIGPDKEKLEFNQIL